MHRALCVSEILLQVFMHVNRVLDPYAPLLSYREISLARKSFAALARTCKLFYEPAMDLLWAELDGIKPLLGCVTRLHPVMYCRGGSKYLCFEVIEPLYEHETCQFLHHAHRVRSLRILHDDYLHVLSDLLIECMFPRLLSLSTDRNLNRYLHLFPSPTLRRCTLPCVQPDLKSVPIRCAALEDLSIKSSFGNIAADGQVLYDSIRLCKRLVTLACPPLDWTTLEYLSNLPTLRTLEIWDDRCSLGSCNLTFAPFLNITTLYFYTRRVAYTIAVMQHLDFPSLNQFEMDIVKLPWAEAEPLFHALSRHKTLSHIAISSERGDQELQDLLGNSSTPIRQFLCFTQLRILRFNFPCCCINLDNDLLLEAMSSWPHIRMLEFVDPQAAPTVTFRGLFTALHRCPRLHTLDIPLDTTDIDVDPTADSFLHTSLRHLNLTSSAMSNAEGVSRIISSVLPSVDRTCPPGYKRPSGICLEVQKHLESFRESSVLGRHILT
ncbi:uncharacterized protein EDB93DRAFT_752653 [Suillus bovinus]|uniref:uncharacterized protein n=1 Tax=Suillus bovinus TaxID=48563 RepID=UPI001B87E3DB|nr:uncharacterized protein EDB93DRAFT_752653 [Suillus bovinus]KAG2137853.1 hypothetical protein EDB93DRAFT_752653 [Suillus bovinus]